jgi:hypothetical protein
VHEGIWRRGRTEDDLGTIRPWVGNHYADGVLGKRVLLLGESNYDKAAKPQSDYSDILCENVRDCVFNGRVGFFTKAAKLVLMGTGATHISRQQVLDFWDRVLFTNYIQRVFRSDRARPSPEDWELGRPALSEVVSEHRPDIVIVMGLELRSHLDSLLDVAPDVGVIAVAHPSSFGFKYDKWVPTVRDAFALHGRGST